ncbi:MAG TPA: phosphoglycerate dehydrogenase [Anaerolineales bacterium]|nr:phosphoglycerate dehydrogenase [Anaerolineales bacterium]
MPVILFSAPYMLMSLERFRPVLEGYGLELITPEVHERLEEADLLKYAGQIDGAICGDDRFSASVLEACAPRLKVISKWGTGVDSIDAAACARLGIELCRTPNAFTLPVADSVMGYLLAFARRQPWMDKAMKAGLWQKIPGRALHECTLGIIGVGTIGKTLARRARAFGMNILGNDIVEIDHVFIAETAIQMTSLEALLSASDFVSVNCDLNPTSYHLINARTLGFMRREAFLINCARGPIVDETALVEALEAGRIAGAALDVFEVEPLPADCHLKRMDNVLLAPHNSNSSPAAWERVHRNTIKNLIEGLGFTFDENMRF